MEAIADIFSVLLVVGPPAVLGICALVYVGARLATWVRSTS